MKLTDALARMLQPSQPSKPRSTTSGSESLLSRRRFITSSLAGTGLAIAAPRVILDVGAAYRDGDRRFRRTKEYGDITLDAESFRASMGGLDAWCPMPNAAPLFGLDRTASRHFTGMDLGYPDGKGVDFVQTYTASDRFPGEDGQAYLRRQMQAMSEWELRHDRDLPGVRGQAEYLHAHELERALHEAEGAHPVAEYLQSAELEREIVAAQHLKPRRAGGFGTGGVASYDKVMKEYYERGGDPSLVYPKNPLFDMIKGKS